jgi:pimeloyl-ACP methyl ester carboxylesterase
MDTAALEAPSQRGAVRELSALAEFPRLALSLPRLLRLGSGEGRPVLVVPGFGTGDASTLVLRSYLRALGHAVHGWGEGVNRGDVPELIPRVVERTEALARAGGQPVRVVGWSLGGVLARETARRRPELVERVVTLGSPVVGGPKYTLAASFYRRQGVDLDALEREIAELDATPIRVPITALYSRSDGVVAWRACIDRVSPHVEHVEVGGSHAGLGFRAEVYRIVAERLAAPAAARA